MFVCGQSSNFRQPVGVGALRRPVLKRKDFFMFISCYTARNEPKKRTRGVPLDSLPPLREERRNGTNEAIKKQRLSVNDTKGCVGERTRFGCFGYTVRFISPTLVGGFLIRLGVNFKRMSADSRTFTVNSVGVGALRRPVLKRKDFLCSFLATRQETNQRIV